jgi:hypothetical protein
MQDSILIGIMVDYLHPLNIERFISLDGGQVMIFKQGVNIDKKLIPGLLLQGNKWTKSYLPLPDVVYNQCYSEQRPFINKLEQKIGKRKVFNYVTAFDKWEIHKVLLKGGLGKFLPRTYRYERHDIITLLHKEKKLILKPRKGNQGKNIFLFQQSYLRELQLFEYSFKANLTFATVEKFKKYMDEKIVKHGPYLMQQKINIVKLNNQIFDLRILLQKDETGKWRITGDLSRLAVKDFFITNVCSEIYRAEDIMEMARIKPQNLIDDLHQLSLFAAKLLEDHFYMLGEICVDFALDEEGNLWIIEVNGKPDKNLFFYLKDEQLLKRLYSAPFKYAYFLARNNKFV